VDYNFFSKGNREKGIKEWDLKNKFVVMQSGLIVEARNQLESIKAIEKVKEKIPNVLLVLTGKEDPQYKKKLDEYIKEKKLERYVKYAIFSGDKEKLRNLYKTADIGIFPILGQGGVLAPFEMLSAGIPIIISEDMETASFIKSKNLGIVTKDYCNAILEIYNNQEKHKNIALTGAKFVKENLSWETFTEKMIKAFMFAWKKNKN
jgi:glycosyltransferase involved in cell wall biosynthesis